MSASCFLPGKDAALRHLGALNGRFRESLAHLFERCSGHVDFDPTRADALLAQLDRPLRVAPALFGHYFDAVDAVAAQDLPALQRAIDELTTRAPETAPPALQLRPLNREGFTEEEEAAFRRQFVSDSLHDSQLSHLTGPPCDAALVELRASLALLRDHAPTSYSEMETLVSEIVPAHGEAVNDLEFDGASSLKRWGTVLINMSRSRSPAALAETLVHEAAHGTLFAMSPVEFYLHNGADARYASPLRADPRPLDGIYHATFVLARMHFAMRELTDAPGITQDARTEAIALARQSRKGFLDGHAVLSAHADYTPTGRRIMEGAHAYMQTLETC
ncbi:aKG-HExxH-type peptide beta-hydroxylase [Stappia stellulata]|uniref:aKG-HExxH-type peptide beta-hydroxylase n=1 Tax=Stappia stellulata TaxID=71235 RepID=UPI00146E0C97|nr:HEXXH motif-containing putative peptide modification protein [Stappia stellulata]